MDNDVKLSSHPGELSYYTTWWLTAVPSTSSQTTTLSGLHDDNDPIVKDQKGQKKFKNKCKCTCCIPFKMFRFK